MKYNLFFTLSGPAGESEVPHLGNPAECETMRELLLHLVGNVLPGEAQGLETTGIRIEKVT